MTDYKIKEFQRLNKIAELERTLQQERNNLAKLRKDKYELLFTVFLPFFSSLFLSFFE
jgi:hypothetical protein